MKEVKSLAPSILLQLPNDTVSSFVRYSTVATDASRFPFIVGCKKALPTIWSFLRMAQETKVEIMLSLYMLSTKTYVPLTGTVYSPVIWSKSSPMLVITPSSGNVMAPVADVLGSSPYIANADLYSIK